MPVPRWLGGQRGKRGETLGVAPSEATALDQARPIAATASEKAPRRKRVEQATGLETPIKITGGILVAMLAAHLQIKHVRNEAYVESDATLDYFETATTEAVRGPMPHHIGEKPTADEPTFVTTRSSYSAIEYATAMQDEIAIQYQKQGKPEKGTEILGIASKLVEAGRSDTGTNSAVLELARKTWELIGDNELGQTADLLASTRLDETLRIFNAQGGTLTDAQLDSFREKVHQSLPGAVSLGLKAFEAIVPFGRVSVDALKRIIKPLTENRAFVLQELRDDFANQIDTKGITLDVVRESTRTLLDTQGIKVDDVDLIQVATAIAAQTLLTYKDALIAQPAPEGSSFDWVRSLEGSVVEHIAPIAEVAAMLDSRQPEGSSLIATHYRRIREYEEGQIAADIPVEEILPTDPPTRRDS